MVDVYENDRTMRVHGKGNRERLAFVIEASTASLLDRYLKERRGAFINEPALLTSATGSELTTDSVRLILRTLTKAAGVSQHVTPHMLRHTAATSLLENGADIRIVQEFLGHDSIRSTERYTHVTCSHLYKVLQHANPLKYVA
jgi:integrase/recombinase XerD